MHSLIYKDNEITSANCVSCNWKEQKVNDFQPTQGNCESVTMGTRGAQSIGFHHHYTSSADL